jgi:hypothetical protein
VARHHMRLTLRFHSDHTYSLLARAAWQGTALCFGRCYISTIAGHLTLASRGCHLSTQWMVAASWDSFTPAMTSPVRS